MRVHARAGIGSRLIATVLASVLVCSLVPVTAGAVTGLPEVLPDTTEWFVDPAGSDANAGTSWDDAFETIGAAVEAADADDVIYLAEGSYTGEFPIMLGSDVDGLSFVGAGYGATILDAEGESRIFDVYGASITFEEMSFDNGSAFGAIDAGVDPAFIIEVGTGGAVNASEADLDFTNCTFASNYAAEGGAIAISDGTLSATGCGFYANGAGYDYLEPEAQIEEPVCEYGGAVRTQFSEYTFADCEFYDNIADYTGGAIAAFVSSGTVDGSSFMGNQSIGSLGLVDGADTADVNALSEVPLIGGIVSVVEGSSGITDSGFSYNFVMGSPAVGYGAQLDVASCEFTENMALVGGPLMIGDLSALYSSTAAADIGVEPETILEMPWLGVERCVVSGNMDSVAGIMSFAALTGISNTLITDNLGMLTGVVTMDIPEGMIVNSTIAGNEAQFGVMDMTGALVGGSAPADIVPMLGTLDIYNSIVWEGVDYSVAGANVYASDLSTGIAESMPVPNTAGVMVPNISEDPMFVAPEMGDYRLVAGSPCIDTALDFEGAPADDLDGLSRPVDGDDDTVEEYDMGCYEFFGNVTDRVSGDDRYQTAIAISQDHFASAETVVLATGRTFADGLSASGLAGVFHAPLLLTDATELSAGVAEEIERLGASHVIITGESEAITLAVEEELMLMGLETERIGGEDRYETAALIAERILEEDPEAGDLVFLARGDLFADALTASPVAYTNHAPVLLVRPDEMPPATIDIVEVLGAADVVIVGGETAVSEGVASQASALFASPTERIDGADRYETSANFSEWAVDGGYAAWNVVGVATGQDFPDALSGGAGIGTQNGTLMLTPRDSVHPAIDAVLSAVGDQIVRLQLFGGVNAVDEATKTELLSYLP